MQQGTAHRPPTAVVELLVLPPLAGLSEHQVRGMTCVWDGVALATGTAVDLGAQTTSRAGQPLQWFPRACPACITDRGRRALYAHAPFCEQCVDEADKCETGRGLYRLMREARR